MACIHRQVHVALPQGNGNVAEEVSGIVVGDIRGALHSAGDGTAHGSGDCDNVLCQPPCH